MIPTPQEGQPLDLQYIASMAQAITDLESAVSTKTYSLTYVKNQDGVAKHDKTSNVSFYAAFYDAMPTKTIPAYHTETFTHNFTHSFVDTPIVTITPVNVGNAAQGRGAVVVISEVTSGSISGQIRFNNKESGTVSLGLNIIAIGFRNTSS